MKLFSEKAVKEFYNPPEVEILDKWLDDNNKKEFKSTKVVHLPTIIKNREIIELQYEYSQEYAMASGLWFLKRNYPKVDEINNFYFAYLISKFVVDFPNLDYGIDFLPGELIGTKLIIALADGTSSYDGFYFMLPEKQLGNTQQEMYTKKTLSYLVEYFYKSEKKAVIKMIEENDISIAAEVVLALATSGEEHSNLFNRLKKVVDNIKDNKKTKETLIEIANGVFDRRS